MKLSGGVDQAHQNWTAVQVRAWGRLFHRIAILGKNECIYEHQSLNMG